jgi:phosphoribosylanthranilate isomerase
MSTQIKISGITSAEDARLATSLGADMLACVFWARSSRYVELASVWEIRRALPSYTPLVGIFVDSPLPIVQQLVYQGALDQAQLFGREPKSEVDAIRPRAFKALNIDRPSALDAASKNFLPLRTSKLRAPAILINLTGDMAADWRACAALCGKAPTILASPALTPVSLGEALQLAKPWGVDAWSAVEAEPGKLDPDRLAAFVDAVRNADRSG